MADQTQQQITVRAAAAALGVSETAVLKRIKRGTLPAIKDPGGRWLVTMAAGSVPDTGTGQVPDTDGQSTGQVPDMSGTPTDQAPAALLVKIATLEAENTALKAALEDARRNGDAWQDQAQQALQALTNQQALALPGAQRTMQALDDGSGRPGLWARIFRRR